MAHAANNGKKRGPGGVERALVIVGFLVWVYVNAFRIVCWLNVATGVERCEKTPPKRVWSSKVYVWVDRVPERDKGFSMLQIQRFSELPPVVGR